MPITITRILRPPFGLSLDPAGDLADLISSVLYDIQSGDEGQRRDWDGLRISLDDNGKDLVLTVETG